MIDASSVTSPLASGRPPQPTLSTEASSSQLVTPASTASMATPPVERMAHATSLAGIPNDQVDNTTGNLAGSSLIGARIVGAGQGSSNGRDDYNAGDAPPYQIYPSARLVEGLSARPPRSQAGNAGLAGVVVCDFQWTQPPCTASVFVRPSYRIFRQSPASPGPSRRSSRRFWARATASRTTSRPCRKCRRVGCPP